MREKPSNPAFQILRYEGDDIYSWAVFRKGSPRPVVAGLSRQEAKHYKRQLESKYTNPH